MKNGRHRLNREHSTHPKVQHAMNQHRKAFVRDLVIAAIFIIAATVITCGLVALPLWLGICLGVGSIVLVRKCLVDKKKLSMLEEAIAPTVIEQDTNIPRIPNESSYVKSLAPVMPISPSTSSENGLDSFSEVKRIPRELAVREPENKMTIHEGEITFSQSPSPG